MTPVREEPIKHPYSIGRWMPVGGCILSTNDNMYKPNNLITSDKLPGYPRESCMEEEHHE
jgi:hypothetical protein